jgi:hypothetical protein
MITTSPNEQAQRGVQLPVRRDLVVIGRLYTLQYTSHVTLFELVRLT